MRRKFPTRKYRTSGPHELWQLDLMEMIPYASVNQSHRYILTCIDVFSRVARAFPIKTKDGVSVAYAMTKILDVNPIYIQTDLGKEFYNKHVEQVLKKRSIKHYSVHSQFKAAIVERFNRTLRERLSRIFTHQNNKTWTNILDKVIYAYNHSPHRGLGDQRPIDISNKMEIWSNQEDQQVKWKPKSLINVGELVRISRISISPFRKIFDKNWCEEIFRVTAIDKRETPVMYVIQDLKDDVLQGKFYHHELQPICKTLPKVYSIERVIRTRDTGKHKQYFIKWYGNSHNS